MHEHMRILPSTTTYHYHYYHHSLTEPLFGHIVLSFTTGRCTASHRVSVACDRPTVYSKHLHCRLHLKP